MKKVLLSSLLMTGSLWAACPSGTTSLGLTNKTERCALKGKYLSTQITLTAKNEYVLQDGVFIGGDNEQSSKLYIEAGTKILGLPGSFLVVMRGSQIYAQGTATKPIVFTSAQAEPKRGDWGGLVLNGNAPINACAQGATVCEAISEGIKVEAVKFGGNNPTDNSGVIKYARFEYGGYPISPDNELNGITFNGVGNKTLIDYVQVHRNSDDGVEFFGGTVDVKHLVLTENEDDSLDWDMGWVGRAQYLLMVQANDIADNGIEADNLKSPMNALPRSNPTISNMTIIGSPKSGYGMLLRRGTSASIMNSIVAGSGKGCVDIDDNETFKNNGVKITSTLFQCAKNFELEAGDLWSTEDLIKTDKTNLLMSADLNKHLPTATSPIFNKTTISDDLFFDEVSYIGAIESAKQDWTKGWTVGL
ncbi:MAG: hypothetical protein HUU56_03835 [Bdellovibrionaceae bacterium]|nr:hypothetical protein [Pseudobdellovibrionaceae bacterium]